MMRGSRWARVQRGRKGLARIAATRDAIGPDVDLLVDCHWRLDEQEAEEVIREGAAHRLYWVECPLPETDANLPALRRLRSLANARGIRLAGCELGIGQEGFAPFLRAGAYDAMMPDAKYVGGLAEMLRVAERFAEAGVAFSPAQSHRPGLPCRQPASLRRRGHDRPAGSAVRRDAAVSAAGGRRCPTSGEGG